MNTITLQQVLPAVFSETHEGFDSDVWLKNLTIEKGKFYLIEAASGTGKSSFCSYLYGYRHDYSGEILFDNKSSQLLSTRQWTSLRRSSLSFLFQDLRLFPELTARENIELKNNITHHKSELEIRQFFEMMGINDKWDTKVSKMSFGQQQRIAFIRALCQPFDFILLDEPISHLDGANGHIMARILLQECKVQNAGIIVTSIGKHLEINYDKILSL